MSLIFIVAVVFIVVCRWFAAIVQGDNLNIAIWTCALIGLLALICNLPQ